MALLLERFSYPEPHLRPRNGIWRCRVYIPEALSTLFGTTNYLEKTLSTSNKSLAEKLLWRKANEIYDKFDQKQMEYLEHQYAEQLRTQKTLDAHVQKRIINFANAFSVPSIELVETTSLDELKAHRDTLETFASVLVNTLPDPTTSEGQSFYTQVYSRDLGSWELPKEDTPKRMVGGWQGQEVKVGATDNDRMDTGFTKGQIKAAIKYKASSVHSFWCDLFILAADKQKLKPPTLPTPEKMWSKTYEDAKEEVFNFYKTIGAEDLLPVEEDLASELLKESDRPRTTDDPLPKKITSYFDSWDKVLARDYEQGSSAYRKLRKGIRLFVDLVGDLQIEELEPFHAFSFADRQIEENPMVSKSVLKDNQWAASSFLNHLVEKGLIKINPFASVRLGERRGVKTRHYQDFRREQLFDVFNHDWSEEDRLFLSILVTTGMRSWEAASLTWEQYNDTEYQGIRYFDLTKAKVKTEGSKRKVPLHPALILPPKKTKGRLFSYAKGHENDVINAVLTEMFGNDRLKIHSFRRTLKKHMRDAGIPMDVNHHYIGHGLGDSSPNAYLGMSVDAVYEGICKMSHPYLKG